MANLKKLPANKQSSQQLCQQLSLQLPKQLAVFLRQFFAQQKLANPQLVVALSGGVDSTVLLHALSIAQKTIVFQLSAHHVHHGLSKHADAWANFCRDFCHKLTIPLNLSHVTVNKNNGLGVEATARTVRYAALQTDLNSWLCLAHHQDDQAETLLLQLARGAGVKGLAGMAFVDVNRQILRPLLGISRAEIEAYATQNKLKFVVDESNSDTQFDRNFMRHKLLPLLQTQYPGVSQTLSRTASHMASANDLLDELAVADAKLAGFESGLNTNTLNKLALSYLSTLSENRINNCLRWWMAQMGLQMPSQQQLQQICQQLMHAKVDANIAIKVSESQTLKRYKQHAYLVDEIPSILPINILWQGEETITLPNNTQLTFSKKMGEGLSLRKIANAKLRIKFREGNERFLPELGRPRRSLKVMLQNAEMPPWQREQLPLIFMDETLVIIPNISVDASLQADHTEVGLTVNCLLT